MSTLQRFKGAAFGLGTTLVPLAVLACAQILLAPYTLATVYGVDPAIDAWAVSSFRRSVVEVYAIIALIMLAYWLLVATLGRGQVLRIRSANTVLALSVLPFALLVIASTVTIPERLFKGACPLLGHSDELPTPGQDVVACFDCQSACEMFVRQDATRVLVGLSLILLVTSAILRIVVSRRR